MSETHNPKASNIVWHQPGITREQREQRNGHAGTILWFTGLSGSGKSTLAHALEVRLHELGCHTFVCDGDNLRHGLCGDLGFSHEDRTENIRRIGQLSKLLIEAGMIVLTAFISPFRADRRRVRMMTHRDADFIEIYCRCPIEVCEQRDVKGLYRRARQGDIAEFTGISSPYEEPENADLIIDTDQHPVEECVQHILDFLFEREVIRRPGNGRPSAG